MTGFLVDTHAFIWFTEDSPKLSATARMHLETQDSRIVLSAASLWEMAIKSGTGKLRLPGDPLTLAQSQGMTTLDVTSEHAWATRNLPKVRNHKDPFDRMLAAQAKVEGLTMLSSDEAFDAYGVDRTW